MFCLQHLKECSSAGSVCYNEKENLLIVSICKAVSKGDDTPNEIWIYDNDFRLLETIAVPATPKISMDYVRWVTTDLDCKEVWVAYGDNKIAVLWKYSRGSKTWKLVTQQDGDLEHPCFIDKDRLAIISWNENENWKIKIFNFNPDKDKVMNTKILNVTSETNDINEPWCLTVSKNGTIYAYDYQSGAIIPFFVPNYKAGDFVGAVKAGQWAGLEIANEHLYVSCSDERCIHVFRAK